MFHTISHVGKTWKIACRASITENNLSCIGPDIIILYELAVDANANVRVVREKKRLAEAITVDT